MGLFRSKPHAEDGGVVLTLPDWSTDAIDAPVDDLDDDAFAAAIAAAREADSRAADERRAAEYAVSA